MGLISRTADLVYTFRFLKLLVTPWEELEAYKLGIIDKNGRNLRRASTLITGEEKSAYNTFHRLIFNIKRLLNKVPFGKTRIASYAAALYLLKEETGMSDEGLKRILEKAGITMDEQLDENTWFLNKEGKLQPGVYMLTGEAPLEGTYEFRARTGTRVEVTESVAPVGSVFGIPVFRAFHKDTRQFVFVSTSDLSR